MPSLPAHAQSPGPGDQPPEGIVFPTAEELEQHFYAPNRNLPPAPVPVPRNYPARFRWDQIQETDPTTNETVTVNYVPPSWRQDGGTCWLFSAVNALSTIAAYQAVQQGWYDPWQTEDPNAPIRDRSFRLSPVTMFTCTKCADPIDLAHWTGIPDTCVDPYRPFGDWHMGLAGSNKNQSPCDSGSCGQCGRYDHFDYSSPTYPYHSECGPIQSHSSEPVYFGVDTVSSLPTGHPNLETLASLIYHYGPIKVDLFVYSDTESPLPDDPNAQNDFIDDDPYFLPPDRVWRCNPDWYRASHLVSAIGYDLTSGHHHLLIQNSWGDSRHLWLDYENWSVPSFWVQNRGPGPFGCGLASAGEVYTDPFIRPASTDVEQDRLDQRCDPDDDGVVGPHYTGHYCQNVSCAGDNCPTVFNPTQNDSDLDDLGDACDDSYSYNPDPDGDGVADGQDNCPTIANRGQQDTDGDGLGEGRTRGAYLYMTQSGASPVAAPQPALLAIAEPIDGQAAGQAEAQVVDLSSTLNLDLPTIDQAKVAPLPDGLGLVLFGHPTGAAFLEAWRLDLIEGRLFDSGPMTGLPSNVSITWSSDGRSVFLAGINDDAMAIWKLDPFTFRTERIPTSGEVLPVARTGATMTYDDQSRSLILAGGAGGDAVLSDTWRLSLDSKTWQPVSGQGAPSANGVLVPIPGQDALWFFSGLGQPIDQPLPVANLSQGAWHQVQIALVANNVTWPLQGELAPAMSQEAGWLGDPDAAWPGQVSLLKLETDAPASLTVQVGSSLDTVTGLPQPDGTIEAAVTCPANEPCLAQVRPTTAEAAWSSFTLSRVPAELGPAQTTNLPGRERDLAGLAFGAAVATTHGLFTVGPDRHLIDAVTGALWNRATAVIRCGSALCVSRIGIIGLRRAVVSETGTLQPAGKTVTAGLGWDLATDGTRVFVAHGILGVGLYDASTNHMQYIKSLVAFPWSRIVTVAVGQGRLYAGAPNGKVQIRNLADLGAQPIEFQVGAGLKRLRMKGRHILALTNGGTNLEVYDAAQPDTPQLVSAVNDDALTIMTAADAGLHRFWLTRNHLSVAQYEPAQGEETP